MSILSQVRKAADVRDVHIDVPASNISVAYLQGASEFIAGRVFPVVPVGKQNDKYWEWPRNTFFRNRATKWTPGSNMPQSQFDVQTASYVAEYRAFEHPLRWDIRDAADEGLNMDRAAVEFVTRVLLLKREVEWASTFFATGVWTTEYTGGTNFPKSGTAKWSDYSASKPIEDVREARLALKKATGFAANKLVLGEQAFEVLADHPDLKELYKYNRDAVLTPAQIAAAMRVEQIEIAGATQITSVEGAATDTYDFVAGKHALLVHVAPRPSLMTPSAGYILSYRGGFSQGFETAIERVDDRRVKATYTQGYTCYDMKKVSADLGAFFLNAVA